MTLWEFSDQEMHGAKESERGKKKNKIERKSETKGEKRITWKIYSFIHSLHGDRTRSLTIT